MWVEGLVTHWCKHGPTFFRLNDIYSENNWINDNVPV